ncbi:MAG: tRNA (adenosine(37)-N6)-threonylcarbamoyltransferase complex dimerization subunit type 1 TsaB [Chitinophagales bacterium]
MALILSIETSSPVCSVCLSRNGKMIGLREDHSGLNHASLLTVFIQELFSEANLNIKQLDAVTVSAGPGSYTGLRIGVATAKGICYSISKPLIAVDSLQILAKSMQANFNDERLWYCPVIDARRNEIYFSLLDSKDVVLIPSRNMEVSALTPFEIAPNVKIIIGGSGANKCLKLWDSSNLILDSAAIFSAQHMMAISEEKFMNSQFENVARFEPSYIKPVFISTVKRSS